MQDKKNCAEWMPFVNVNETALPKWIGSRTLDHDAHAEGESTAISWTPNANEVRTN